MRVRPKSCGKGSGISKACVDEGVREDANHPQALSALGSPHGSTGPTDVEGANAFIAGCRGPAFRAAALVVDANFIIATAPST